MSASHNVLEDSVKIVVAVTDAAEAFHASVAVDNAEVSVAEAVVHALVAVAVRKAQDSLEIVMDTKAEVPQKHVTPPTQQEIQNAHLPETLAVSAVAASVADHALAVET